MSRSCRPNSQNSQKKSVPPRQYPNVNQTNTRQNPRNTSQNKYPPSTLRKNPVTNLSLMERDSERDTFDEVADMARSGYRLAKKIADLVNIETKCMYLGQTALNPVPTPVTYNSNWSSTTLVTLNEPSMGDNDYQRISDSIKVQHLDIMLHARSPGVFLDHLPAFRIIVLWDETNHLTTANEVLEAAFFGTYLITTIPKDWEEKANSKILYDKLHKPYRDTYGWKDANGFAGNGTALKRVSIPINLHTQFDNGTQTIVTGGLKMFIVSDSATEIPIVMSSRILYTDD